MYCTLILDKFDQLNTLQLPRTKETCLVWFTRHYQKNPPFMNRKGSSLRTQWEPDRISALKPHFQSSPYNNTHTHLAEHSFFTELEPKKIRLMAISMDFRNVYRRILMMKNCTMLRPVAFKSGWIRDTFELGDLPLPLFFTTHVHSFFSKNVHPVCYYTLAAVVNSRSLTY